ncbi:MAG: orotidine-5'-phosphate decarboxylase [Veillonella sp.]|nr:orotidine-5'-phosphate decarboxylase [Veillonella sp.]
MADDRLIVALDVSTMDAVKEIVLSLGDSVSFYKVGMELFYAEGAKTIRFLQEQNKQVFLDLKLHDIPNTVAHGVASLTRLGASLITLHGQGGPVMMKAAVEAARESGKELGVERPKLLAITALTSFDDESWTAIGGQLPISDQVIRLAKLAKDCGMDGVVCSALEAKMIREACGDDFLIVTPGIRPSFATTDDQKRVAQHPKYTEKLCKELAERFRDQNVELVIGPMTGGILLAHEVGKALGTRAIFTEREKGIMTLRRGFKIEPGTRVLIVEDIVTTGGSVQEVVNVVNQSGGEIVGVGLLVNRSGGKAEFGVPHEKVQALLNLEVPTYKPEECPLCKDGVAMTERGSKHIK